MGRLTRGGLFRARSTNLIVDSVEDGLRFWVDRLGFRKTVEVPHGDRLGFVILDSDGVELMLQSRASLAQDVIGRPWCPSEPPFMVLVS